MAIKTAAKKTAKPGGPKAGWQTKKFPKGSTHIEMFGVFDLAKVPKGTKLYDELYEVLVKNGMKDDGQFWIHMSCSNPEDDEKLND